MIAMARLTNDHKLSARTHPDVVERFGRLVLRLQKEGLTFQSGPQSRRIKVKNEGLLGAVVLHFLELPEAEQVRLAHEYVPRLESMLCGPASDVGRRNGPVVRRQPAPPAEKRKSS